MSYLTKKYTKFNFGWGSAPDPAEGANSTPPDLAGLRKGRGQKGGEGMEGEEMGGGEAQKGLQHQAQLGLNPALG